MDYVKAQQSLVVKLSVVAFLSFVGIGFVIIDPSLLGLHVVEEIAEFGAIGVLLFLVVRLSRDVQATIDNLKKVLDGQKRFMQNISHELKTPIAKGKFALELFEDNPSEYKHTLARIFESLEQMSEDLLLYEQLESGYQPLQIQPTLASEVLQESMDILMPESEQVSIKLEDFELRCDVRHLGIALKNIIENGIKYSNNHTVYVVVSNRSFKVFSHGVKLERELSYYTEPFVRATNQNSGHGLGLTIVQKIVALHHFEFGYKHIMGENIFSIEV